MGLSIWGKTIVDKLASGILKQTVLSSISSTPPAETVTEKIIIDSHSKQILEKLQEIINENKKIREENKNLREHIVLLEKKVDHSQRMISKVEKKLDLASISRIVQDIPIDNPNISSSVQLPLQYTKQNRTSSTQSFQDDKPLEDELNTSQTEKHSINSYQGKPTNHNPSRGSPSNDSPSTKKFSSYSSTLVYITNKRVTGSTKPYSLFVGGFNPQMELKDIRDTIQDQVGIKIIDITSNRINKFNQSVRIDIDVKDKENALSPDTWFKGIVVKPFKQMKKYSWNQYRDNQRNYNYFTSHSYQDNHNNDNDKYNDCDKYDESNNYNTYNGYGKR